MSFIQIVILAIIQGLAELLPVSSSAHVIVAQKLMGLDPSSPEMTFFLVMLHTGTMFAVLFYFWKRWRDLLRDVRAQKRFLKALIMATIATGVLGLGLKLIIEKIILEHFFHYEKGEVEQLFSFLPLIALSLAVVGVLILVAGLKKQGRTRPDISGKDSLIIGLVQGLCLPFRGLSRSGATISTGLLLNIPRALAEEFSFALAVILTPPVIFLELRRFMKAPAASHASLSTLLVPGLIGMVLSCFAGLLALKWLSAWIENGRWSYFGYYCLVFAALVLALSFTS